MSSFDLPTEPIANIPRQIEHVGLYSVNFSGFSNIVKDAIATVPPGAGVLRVVIHARFPDVEQLHCAAYGIHTNSILGRFWDYDRRNIRLGDALEKLWRHTLIQAVDSGNGA